MQENIFNTVFPRKKFKTGMGGKGQTMVKKYRSGRLYPQSSLLKSIGAKPPVNSEEGKLKSASPVISLVGAGGKTETIRRLAKEYTDRKIPVIVTTTTHMMAEKFPWFVLEPSMEKAMRVLEKYGMVWLGIPDKNGKMQAPPRDFLEKALKLGYPVLVEADGSRKLSIKAPDKHEPVILPETTHVLNLYGLDALGMELSKVCFRAELAARLLNKKTSDLVQNEDIVNLALDKMSGRKGICPGMRYHVILNKADIPQKEDAAKNICILAEKQGFTELTITGNGS